MGFSEQTDTLNWWEVGEVMMMFEDEDDDESS